VRSLRLAALALALVAGSSATADDDVQFFQPFQYGDIWGVNCGNAMGSHQDGGNRYAIDYGLPEGTPVCAAAAGEVVSVVESNDGPTGNPANNNEVAIRHADGRVTVYLHVRKDGVVVAKGDKVERGDLIAYSGNTGATSGPHLHFAVMQRHGGASVPFRFADFGGDGVPKYGNAVTSYNFPVRFQAQYDAVQTALRARDLARAVDCWELAAKPLEAVAGTAMPMPLRVLQEASARRDEALREYQSAAIDAVNAVGEAQAAGDVKRAVRVAVLAQRDFGESGQAAALKDVLSKLQKSAGWKDTYAALADEWTFRPKLLEAAREELAGKDARTLARLWRTAFAAAPERLKLRVEAHLAVIEAGMTQGEVGYSQPYEWQQVGYVTTGNGSGHHMDDRNRYAFDFAMPRGSPVLASAAGVVVAVKQDTIGPTGRDEDDNLVAIRHADGMVSVYRHLEFRSVVVAAGQKVGRGDFLGWSGDTGNCDPAHPHLHFGLQRSVDGASVPMRFIDFGGSGVPDQGNAVTSYNFPQKYIAANEALRGAVRIYDLATRFGCVEPGGRRLASVREIVYDMPLRSLWEPTRLRDAAWTDYEARAAAALVAAGDAKADYAERVRLAKFGCDDFACSSKQPDFAALLKELASDARYAATTAALQGERDYRTAIEYAMRSEVEGRDPAADIVARYRTALRRAPPAVRDALERHVAGLMAGTPR
jgi:murein DD-endopeptidase MepM/ murein hydrolase activator NlpD